MRNRRFESVWGGGAEGAQFSHILLRACSSYVSSGMFPLRLLQIFVGHQPFSKLASGRTRLVRRSAYTTQYRFRAPMMQLAARLLEGLNSIGRGWLYFFIIIIATEEVETTFGT